MGEKEIFCAGENMLFPESEFRKQDGNWVHKTAKPIHWANTGLPIDNDDDNGGSGPALPDNYNDNEGPGVEGEPD